MKAHMCSACGALQLDFANAKSLANGSLGHLMEPRKARTDTNCTAFFKLWWLAGQNSTEPQHSAAQHLFESDGLASPIPYLRKILRGF